MRGLFLSSLKTLKNYILFNIEIQSSDIVKQNDPTHIFQLQISFYSNETLYICSQFVKNSTLVYIVKLE